jgi:hypothetical protein
VVLFGSAHVQLTWASIGITVLSAIQQLADPVVHSASTHLPGDLLAPSATRFARSPGEGWCAKIEFQFRNFFVRPSRVLLKPKNEQLECLCVLTGCYMSKLQVFLITAYRSLEFPEKEISITGNFPKMEYSDSSCLALPEYI